jgi:hypothetical protein
MAIFNSSASLTVRAEVREAGDFSPFAHDQRESDRHPGGSLLSCKQPAN